MREKNKAKEENIMVSCNYAMVLSRLKTKFLNLVNTQNAFGPNLLIRL